MIRQPGRLVRAKGLPGATLWKWEPPVPFLPQTTEESAIFLYPSVDDAMERTKWGGSGFLIAVPSEANPSRVHLYAVSNEHVSTRCPVIRRSVPLADKVGIVPGEDSDWIEHPDGDDIAVRPLGDVPAKRGPLPTGGYQYLEAAQLMTREDLLLAGPGLGDDCYMIGRYINHEGKQFDRAVVRFGNLSMLPEFIWQEKRSFEQESFLVDMRSVAGFSGSQVIAYFTEPGTVSAVEMMGGGHPPGTPLREVISKYWILGIDWGHLPVTEDIAENGERKKVKVKSSMAAVVPAWKLTELLNDVEAVVKPRERAEEELAQVNENAAVEDEHGPSELDRTTDLMGKLIQVPKAEIDEKRKES
jgi:hypothetical protein